MNFSRGFFLFFFSFGIEDIRTFVTKTSLRKNTSTQKPHKHFCLLLLAFRRPLPWLLIVKLVPASFLQLDFEKNMYISQA